MQPANPLLKRINAQETYPLRRRVLWPNIPLPEQSLPEDQDPNVTHYGTYFNDRLVSIVTFVASANGDGSVQFRKFATDEGYRSRGIGTALLKFGIDAALGSREGDGKGVLIWCHARTTALAFYAHLGLVPLIPEHRYVKGGIDYIRIGKVFHGDENAS